MVCKIPVDRCQGAADFSRHEETCPGFRITGRIEKGVVRGICTICKVVLESHGKQGEQRYKRKREGIYE